MSTLTLSLTIPRNTPRYLPVSASDRGPLPVVLGGEVIIPAGCAGLVGVRVLHRGHVLVPSDGGWLTGNGRTVAWSAGYLMAGPPFEIVVEGYNTDDTYPHRVEVLVNLGSIRELR